MNLIMEVLVTRVHFVGSIQIKHLSSSTEPLSLFNFRRLSLCFNQTVRHKNILQFIFVDVQFS